MFRSRMFMLLVLAAPAVAQQPAAPLLPGLGDYRRDIGTSGQAQRYFDQGLALTYGFNHDEALRAFQAAAALDSLSPMIQLGIALANAPSVDRGRHPARDRAAREALERARRLVSRARPADAELIEAYAVRYADTTQTGAQLDSAYAQAMGRLWRRYPDDPDIATLYGESLMLLARRRYWNHHDGSAAPGTLELLGAFERAMRAVPRHAGANHYYIHALEMSPSPERALAAADRLQQLAPGAGHLVHMSGHVYFRLGRWSDAVAANRRALAADSALFRLSPPSPNGVYPAGYHLHTLHFLWMAHAMAGQKADALAVAEALARRAEPAANAGLYAQAWAAAPLLVWLRYEDWAAIEAAAPPPANQRYTSAVWTYARGSAAIARGDAALAARHLASLDSLAALIPPGNVAPTAPARPLIESAARSLRACIHLRAGQREEALRLLERNLQVEDSLGLMEPPPWFESAREALQRVRAS